MNRSAEIFAATSSRSRQRRWRLPSFAGLTGSLLSVDAAVTGLQFVYDLSLAAAVLVVPLMMAGVRETGTGLFIACSLLMAVSWCVQQLIRPDSSTRFCGAELIAASAVALVALQLVELPGFLRSLLAPFTDHYLTLWGSSQGTLLGSEAWQQISLTPELTRSGLALTFAYACFFLTLIHRLRHRTDIDRLLRLMALAVTGMALIGLAQLFFGNGKYLWMFEHPYSKATGAAKGTFVNQNHFASFLALGIGPLIWLWQHGVTQTSRSTAGAHSGFGRGAAISQQRLSLARALCGAAIAAVLLAGLLSLSRGGMTALLIAFGVAVTTCTDQWQRILKLALPTLLFAGAGIMAFGAGPFAAELESITKAGSVQDLFAARFHLWSALLESMSMFWPAGAGVGSQVEVYQTWMNYQTSVRFSYAESGFLQVLVETGLPGFLLLCISIGFCLRWTWSLWQCQDRSLKYRGMAVAAGVLASVLHAVIDFAWYIPGCMILTLVALAALCRLNQLAVSRPATEQSRSRRRMQPASERAATPAAALLMWTLLALLIPAGRLSADIVPKEIAAAAHQHAYRTVAVSLSGRNGHDSLGWQNPQIDSMIADLEACVTEDPADHGAASDLAALYLRRFEINLQNSSNQMTLRQVQDTVRNAEFESPQELRAWLTRAFGDNSADLFRALLAARRGIQGQPMRGETYIVLAELGFLVGLPDENRQALVDQAIRLRPYNPSVLYAAGNLLADSGDMQAAFELWQQAFHQSTDIQQVLIKQLAAHLPAQEIMTRLDPGQNGLWILFQELGAAGRPQEQLIAAVAFAERFAEFRDTPAAANATFWLHSYEMLLAAGQIQPATDCLLHGVEIPGLDESVRRALIFKLIEQEQFEPALEQLEWCQLRNPDDKQIQAAVKDVREALNLRSTDPSRIAGSATESRSL